MMKKVFLTLLLAVMVPMLHAATKTQADALYERERYTDATKAYEALLSRGKVAAELYYNLGNCYYKMDEIPRAILNYERALLLDPGDGDIRANLALARGKTIDKVVPPSEMFFVTWWRNLATSMSIDAWAVNGIVAFVLMLVGIAAYVLSSRLVVRKSGFYMAVVMLVIVLVANLAALSCHSDFVHPSAAIVLEPSVSVKSSPTHNSTDLFLIHEGSKVEILDATMREWIEVKFEEGKQGWIPARTVEVI